MLITEACCFLFNSPAILKIDLETQNEPFQSKWQTSSRRPLATLAASIGHNPFAALTSTSVHVVRYLPTVESPRTFADCCSLLPLIWADLEFRLKSTSAFLNVMKCNDYYFSQPQDGVVVLS